MICPSRFRGIILGKKAIKRQGLRINKSNLLSALIGALFLLPFFCASAFGYILIDDYDVDFSGKEKADTPGVKIAADEFLSDKKEKLIHLADSMYYFKKV